MRPTTFRPAILRRGPLLAAALLGVGLAIPLAAAPARAAATVADPTSVVRVEDVAFDRRVEALGAPLTLRGAGLFRWKWFVKVYAAALYVPGGAAAFDPAADVARRLEFSYLVGIERDGFGKAANELLAGNFPPEVIAPLRARIDRLHAAYVDVKPGDRYALSYVPGQGTELSFNGRRLALVEGADFARVYYAIWLGKAPIDTGLRDMLLAR
jgi:hypothetical protein